MMAMSKNATPYLTLVGFRWQMLTASSVLQAEIIDAVEGKITPEKLAADIQAAVNTWFKPNNGPLDAAAVAQLATSHFGLMQAGMFHHYKTNRILRAQQRAAILFILPALGIYALFVLYPLAMSLWGSLFEWRACASRLRRPVEFRAAVCLSEERAALRCAVGQHCPVLRHHAVPEWSRPAVCLAAFHARSRRCVLSVGVLLSGGAEPGHRRRAVAAAARPRRHRRIGP